MRRAGSVCRDLGTSIKHKKNQLCDHMEKSQPGHLGSRYRDVGIPARRAENFVNHVIAIDGPTLFCHSFASDKNGSPKGQYFSFSVTHKGLSDHKAT